jgi:hypothetical protein
MNERFVTRVHGDVTNKGHVTRVNGDVWRGGDLLVGVPTLLSLSLSLSLSPTCW